MRICFVGDARSVHTRRWVEWFARDHDVHLFTPAAHEPLGSVVGLQMPDPKMPGARLAASVHTLRRWLRTAQPDVLHAHYINESGWIAAATGFRPLVVSAWGSDVYRAPHESRLAARLNPWAVQRAEAVTCDSEDQATHLRRWHPDPARIHVIGWGVDRDLFNERVSGASIRAGLGIPEAAPVVLSPRQWIRNSNIETIVAAHALLPSDVHLVLKRLDDTLPADETGVMRAVHASPARERIHVVGGLEESELPALYASADAVVSVCTTDGTSMSVLEAMACGKPIIGLRVASLEACVEPGGGALVDRLDPVSLAEVTAGVLDPAARRSIARRNVRFVAEAADRQVEMARAEQIYCELRSAVAR